MGSSKGSRPRKLPSSSSKGARSPLTPDKIAAIESHIKNGVIRLPPCAENEIWCMVDSGSAPHVANLKRHVPGATLRESMAQKRGIKMSTATGQPFDNKGVFSIPFSTQEGHTYSTTFQNAEVSMPTLSTNRMADSDCVSTFKKNGGTILHEPSGEVSHFIRCYGVYFVKLVVNPELLNVGAPFQRQGAP